MLQACCSGYLANLLFGGRRCLKYQNNPPHTPPIKPLHIEKCAIFSEVQVSKKAELLMFFIFLACLTYFWLWLETARPSVCEIQSCDTPVIWVRELGLVCNRGKLCKCVGKLVFDFDCHCLYTRLTVQMI